MLAGFLWEFVLPLSVVAAVVAAVDRYQDVGLVAYIRADRERAAAAAALLGVVCGLAALTYALGSPPPIGGRNDGITAYHLGLVVAAAGAFMVVHGGRHYRVATTIRDAAVVTPGDLPSSGTVAVTGTAESVGAGTVTAPHSGRAVLAAEAGRVAGSNYGSPDTTRAQGLFDVERRETPFDLVGEYGQVRVDPSGATLAFLYGELEDGVLERAVRPGDEVVVVGRADNGRLVDPVVVASAGNRNLGRFARNVPRIGVAGVVVLLGGALVMLLTAGIL